MRANRVRFRTWLVILVCLLAGVPAVWLLTVRLEGTGPAVKIDLAPDSVVGAREVSVVVEDPKSGLRQIRIDFLKDGKETILYQKDFPSAGFLSGGQVSDHSVAVKIPPVQSKIGDGKGVLRLEATDFSWRGWFGGNRTYLQRSVTIDTETPRIEVLSKAHNVNQGGAGVVIYKISESCPRTGVHVGDEFFPGYSGYFQDPAVHMAFFALGHQQTKGTKLYLSAVDFAGNSGRSGFPHHIRKKKFKKDKIRISDGFLDNKMPEFERTYPSNAGTQPIDIFLKVNRELRKANYRTVAEITRDTDRAILWKGAFLRLPNAARRAGFADHRDYLYNGKRVDRQVHLGIDLASLSRSPVPAANGGRVVFADDLGIYGLVVIVDHGFGLFSMYAHLSSIQVKKGQAVAKGEEIGRTGSTGLAGGDHLHFSVMVGHVFVNPVEWWDGAWIKNNVTDKIALASRETPPVKAAGEKTGG